MRFSICIPTRQRHGTLGHAIRSVLNQTHAEFELVVQDNASSNETRQVVDSFADKRILYRRSDELLAMHDNWERALEGTTGDYVTFLGDDDALMPDCLSRLNRLVDTEKPELVGWPAHLYYWPDVADPTRRNHLSVDLRSGALWSDGFAGQGAAPVTNHRHGLRPDGTIYFDSRQLLRNWLRFDGVRIYVPAYHTLVSRPVIERARQQCGGRYFAHSVPDFGSLIANLYVTREVLFYTRPLSMTGHSRASNGGAHGEPDGLRRTLDVFTREARIPERTLCPSPFAPLVWVPTVLGACFEDMKNLMFPNDESLALDWQGFLKDAAAQLATTHVDDREACVKWLHDAADRIGLSRRELVIPEWAPHTRRRGLMADASGRVFYAFIDGDLVGLQDISQAVRLAATLSPEVDFPIELSVSNQQDNIVSAIDAALSRLGRSQR